MKMHRYTACQAVGAAMLVLVTTASGSYAAPTDHVQRNRIELAQADRQPRELEPRYQPAPPPEKNWYNSSYIFAATRGVADSTMVPAAKVSLYLLTIPFDILVLPVAVIGGLFG